MLKSDQNAWLRNTGWSAQRVFVVHYENEEKKLSKRVVAQLFRLEN